VYILFFSKDLSGRFSRRIGEASGHDIASFSVDAFISLLNDFSLSNIDSLLACQIPLSTASPLNSSSSTSSSSSDSYD